MSTPRFVSPGAMANNALTQFLREREEMEMARRRQAQMEQQQAQAAAQAQADLQLRRQQEARMAEAQRVTQGELAKEREFRRATTVADKALPGDVIDDPTAALLQEHGYGGQVITRPGMVFDETPPELQGPGVLDISARMEGPDTYEMRGGTPFMLAQAQRESATATAEANRQAAAERANADRESREAIARIAAEGRADAQGVRNDLARMQIERERDKLDSARTERTQQKQAVAMERASVRELAREIKESPALPRITGAIEGRRETFLQSDTAQLVRKFHQLRDMLSVSARQKLKGSGAVSDFEARTLQNSVSALDRAAGPENLAKELGNIIAAFEGDEPSQDGATTETTRVRWGRDANGKPVRLP